MLSPQCVTARIVLGAAAVLVLGMCVYLFLEVRTKPVAAEATRVPPHVINATPDPTDPADDVAPPLPKPSVAAVEPPPATPDPLTEPTEPENAKAVYKTEALMAEANKAYDRQDLEEARTIAQKVLKILPNNPRMLRILVSAACQESDTIEAQKHYSLLPAPDRAQMRIRCAKYQVTFTEPK